MKNTIQQELTKAIGHSLRKVVASIHVFTEETLNDAPLCLWLYFESLPGLRLFGSPDAWHIEGDETPPEPMDMGESGEIVLRDISGKSIFRQAIGKELKGAWTVESRPEGEVIGLRFDFGLPLKPIVLNWGDELYLADKYPSDAKAAELLEVPMRPP
ncbi:MAG: hypothetical protein HYZ81_20325 [Nitrospinae bacterium]|nr:hypothetical protein [Nitrospinota bacterium]